MIAAPHPGVPWKFRQADSMAETHAPPAPVFVPTPVYAQALAPVPMPGTPLFFQFRQAAWHRGQPPIAPGNAGGSAGPTSPNKPFIVRVPDPKDVRRLARFTEQVAAIIDSLVAQGKLVEIAPGKWTLNP